MKKINLTIILVVILAMAFSIANVAYAVSVDGKMSEKIWLSVPGELVVSSRDISNCGVTYGTVSVYVDDENNIIYLGFKAICDSSSGGSQLPGVSVSVDGSEFMTLKTDGITCFDTDKYNFSGAVCLLSATSYSAEVSLGMKYGVKRGAKIAFRYIDMDGIPSNVYYTVVPSDTSTEPATAADSNLGAAAKAVNTTANNYTKSNTSKTTAVKTTKAPKTTSVKTTAEKTTKEKTEKQRTTAAKTQVIKQKVIVEAQVVTVYVTVPIVSEEVVADVRSIDDSASTNEATVPASSREIKLGRALTYASVVGLIVISLAFCVAANMAHEKRRNAEK